MMRKPKVTFKDPEPILTWLFIARNFKDFAEANIVAVAVLAVVEPIFGSGLWRAEVILFTLGVLSLIMAGIAFRKEREYKMKLIYDKKREKGSSMDCCDTEYD